MAGAQNKAAAAGSSAAAAGASGAAAAKPQVGGPGGLGGAVLPHFPAALLTLYWTQRLATASYGLVPHGVGGRGAPCACNRVVTMQGQAAPPLQQASTFGASVRSTLARLTPTNYNMVGAGAAACVQFVSHVGWRCTLPPPLPAAS